MLGMPQALRSMRTGCFTETRRIPLAGGTRASASAFHQASNSGPLSPAESRTESTDCPAPSRRRISAEASFIAASLGMESGDAKLSGTDAEGYRERKNGRE